MIEFMQHDTVIATEMRELVLTTTQTDIDEANRGSSVDCLIARALRRALGHIDCTVGVFTCTIDGRRYSVPTCIAEYIVLWTRKRNSVQPATFKVRVRTDLNILEVIDA